MGLPFLMALLGALLLVLAFPPAGLWPLGLLAPWPLALGAIGARTGARCFWRFCLVGVVVIAGGTWWLAETHLFNLAVVTVVEAPIFGLFGWLVHRVLRPDGKLIVLGFNPASWWGFRHTFSRSGFPAGVKRQIPTRRLRDWLQLLNLRIDRVSGCFARKPAVPVGKLRHGRRFAAPTPSGEIVGKDLQRIRLDLRICHRIWARVTQRTDLGASEKMQPWA